MRNSLADAPEEASLVLIGQFRSEKNEQKHETVDSKSFFVLRLNLSSAEFRFFNYFSSLAIFDLN
jgi:hypothetical protein